MQQSELSGEAHHRLKQQVSEGFTSSQQMQWERNTVRGIPKDTAAGQQ